ncbi:hypothetical protein QFZ27_005385 [Inquilinus ginsengisoli]|uniref:hypothetical protein n=1 Tax=Inquilinus ginsengisoli TaxID=363840 RepID=UPI003D210ECC
MDKAQTDSGVERPASTGERTERQLRLLARLTEIGMEIAEKTRTDAVEAPEPGIDYCARFATAARAVRLSMLLEDKLSRQRPAWSTAAMQSALDAPSKAEGWSEEETDDRDGELVERLEQPEIEEMIDRLPAEVAIARLCRKYDLPDDAQRWLQEAMEFEAQLAREDAEDEKGWDDDEEPPPFDPPAPRAAAPGRKPSPPDTG